MFVLLGYRRCVCGCLSWSFRRGLSWCICRGLSWCVCGCLSWCFCWGLSWCVRRGLRWGFCRGISWGFCWISWCSCGSWWPVGRQSNAVATIGRPATIAEDIRSLIYIFYGPLACRAVEVKHQVTVTDEGTVIVLCDHSVSISIHNRVVGALEQLPVLCRNGSIQDQVLAPTAWGGGEGGALYGCSAGIYDIVRDSSSPHRGAGGLVKDAGGGHHDVSLVVLSS